LILFLVFAATLATDQASKIWALRALGHGQFVPIVGRYFQFRLVRNSGSAFGLFSGASMFIFVANLIILGLVVIWATRSREDPLALGLVLAGGLGNLVDRLVRPPGFGMGKVVDFVYLSFWPTFNLADAAIVVGVGLLLLRGFVRTDKPNEIE